MGNALLKLLIFIVSAPVTLADYLENTRWYQTWQYGDYCEGEFTINLNDSRTDPTYFIKNDAQLREFKCSLMKNYPKRLIYHYLVKYINKFKSNKPNYARNAEDFKISILLQTTGIDKFGQHVQVEAQVDYIVDDGCSHFSIPCNGEMDLCDTNPTFVPFQVAKRNAPKGPYYPHYAGGQQSHKLWAASAAFTFAGAKINTFGLVDVDSDVCLMGRNLFPGFDICKSQTQMLFWFSFTLADLLQACLEKSLYDNLYDNLCPGIIL